MKPGDKVTFLDVEGMGELIRIMGDHAELIDDHGFRMIIPVSQLVPVNLGSAELGSFNEASVAHKKNRAEKILPDRPKKKNEIWEIDLHAHELFEGDGNSSLPVLARQLSAFKQFLVDARRAKIQQLVVIHGIGEGILKGEIIRILTKEQGLTYEMADFRLYGQGAIQINLIKY